jgi:hypothetical protein
MTWIQNKKRKSCIRHTALIMGSHYGGLFTIITTSVRGLFSSWDVEFYVSIDPLDFDRKCDGSLPLKEMIKPDPTLIKLFKDIDRSKCRVWALTNAYITVRRVFLMSINCLANRFVQACGGCAGNITVKEPHEIESQGYVKRPSTIRRPDRRPRILRLYISKVRMQTRS